MSSRLLLFIIIYILNPWMLAPAIAYAAARWRGGYQHPEWMTIYARVQILAVIAGIIFTGLSMAHMNNQWMRHLAQPVIFVGYLWTLFRMTPDARRAPAIYGVCLVLGLLAAVAGAFLNGLTWRNSIFTTTMSLVYLVLVTRELKALLHSDDVVPLAGLPSFWVLASLLVYSSGTLIFNASSNYFLRTLPPDLVLIPWVVVGFIHALHEALLAKAFLCRKQISS